MQKGLLFLGLFLSLSLGAFSQTSANNIIGVWQNSDNTSHIEFYKSGNTYVAKIIWLSNPNDESGKPLIDSKNPDLKLRGRKIVGSTVIWGLQFQNSEWRNGHIYLFRRGETVDCKVKMKDSKTIQITVQKGIIKISKEWTKIK